MAHQSQSQKPMGQPMIGAGGVLLNLAYALIATRSSQPAISSGSAIGAGTVGTPQYSGGAWLASIFGW